MTELTSNIIAESMCAQYDIDGHECPLLESFLIIKKTIQL